MMSDESLIRALRALDRPVDVDPAFEGALYAALEREYLRPSRPRPSLRLLLAAALLVALLVGTVLAVGSALLRLPAPDGRILDPSIAVESDCQLPPAPAETRISEIRTGGSLTSGAFAACSFWVGTTAAVQRIDPVTNEIVATIRLRLSDGYVTDLAAHGDAVWVSTVSFNERRIHRIDASTNSVVEEVVLPNTFGTEMLVVDGQVWFHGFEYHRLGVVDLATGGIVHDMEWGYDLPSLAGFGAVWSSADGITRIDPSTLERTSIVRPHPDAYLSWINAEGLWVTSPEEGRVYRLSPDGEVLLIIDAVPAPCCPLTVGGSVYLVSLRDLGTRGTGLSAIVRVDGQTGEVLEWLDYPHTGPTEGPWVAGGSLWVENNEIDIVSRYEAPAHP